MPHVAFDVQHQLDRRPFSLPMTELTCRAPDPKRKGRSCQRPLSTIPQLAIYAGFTVDHLDFVPADNVHMGVWCHHCKRASVYQVEQEVAA